MACMVTGKWYCIVLYCMVEVIMACMVACMVTGKWGEACCTHCTSCSCWMRFQIHLVGLGLGLG